MNSLHSPPGSIATSAYTHTHTHTFLMLSLCIVANGKEKYTLIIFFWPLDVLFWLCEAVLPPFIERHDFFLDLSTWKQPACNMWDVRSCAVFRACLTFVQWVCGTSPCPPCLSGAEALNRPCRSLHSDCLRTHRTDPSSPRRSSQ